MINELKAGMKTEIIVLLRLQKIGNSSNGGVFARGLAEDNSGCLPFICFEAGIVERLRAFDAPKAVRLNVHVDINKFSSDMALQLVVQKMSEVTEQDDISHLLPQGNFDAQLCETRFNDLVQKITHTELQQLILKIFTGDVFKQFLINPAGMRLHHAYVGGLLEHSVSVTELACVMADKIGHVNKDLIIAGALLHDVGKLKEISPEMGFPYTTEGRLLGHITLTAMLVKQVAEQMSFQDDKLLQELLHIVLSHHGDREKGSPIACATKESFIVHYADEIDAIMNQFAKDKDKDQWEYNKMLQRYILF
ncbi:MAG TPA: HD domain-containing protein [Candidatus Avacidaminococcus intestinavium]|uniref:HD domain-containing protein n=1 Tax=Candidatus Avacidaminococcus intestinavium TaxID=2840684 RepID=A0A9D1SK83_9FIRM|nr:HD domain-containing protein [Candidatus Avacidaminococcus intestinavium]